MNILSSIIDPIDLPKLEEDVRRLKEAIEKYIYYSEYCLFCIHFLLFDNQRNTLNVDMFHENNAKLLQFGKLLDKLRDFNFNVS
jgi:hypothetical protein